MASFSPDTTSRERLVNLLRTSKPTFDSISTASEESPPPLPLRI
jgi:hypothetical protein